MSDQSPSASPRAGAEGISHWTPHGRLLAACLVTFNVLLIFLIYFYFWRILQRKSGASSSSTVDAASSSSASSSPAVSPRIRDRREFDLAVASLPIVAIVRPSSGCTDGTEEEKIEECAVCIAEYADGDKARLLPRCGHRFHVECVDVWFQFHTTCPLCRASVMVEPKSAVLDMDTMV